MYHTEKINQASIEKNLKQTRFSSKDLQFAHYVESLSPKFRKIAQVYISHLDLPWVKLKNERVALLAGCSLKTVTRATNKFHEDGFITKHQDNKYAPNNYTFNDKIKRNTFSHWFNSLSAQNQNLYISHGIRIDHKNKIIYSLGNVPQIKNLLLDLSLSRNPNPFFAHRRVREGCVFNKTTDYKKGELMQSIQKQWILKNRFDPTIKDVLSDPQIKPTIITPIVEKLSTLLTLDEKECYKLTAFDDDTLQYVLSYVEPIVKGQRVLKTPVHDRMGWVIGIATAHCAKNNTKPDWSWYYTLCEIVGIDTKSPSEKKPLTVKKQKPTQGIYAPWKAPDEDPLNIRIAKLRRDIEVLSQQIELSNKNPYMILYATSVVERKKQELTELERSSNEKQIVSYRHNSDTMATCSA